MGESMDGRREEEAFPHLDLQHVERVEENPVVLLQIELVDRHGREREVGAFPESQGRELWPRQGRQEGSGAGDTASGLGDVEHPLVDVVVDGAHRARLRREGRRGQAVHLGHLDGPRHDGVVDHAGEGTARSGVLVDQLRQGAGADVRESQEVGLEAGSGGEAAPVVAIGYGREADGAGLSGEGVEDEVGCDEGGLGALGGQPLRKLEHGADMALAGVGENEDMGRHSLDVLLLLLCLLLWSEGRVVEDYIEPTKSDPCEYKTWE